MKTSLKHSDLIHWYFTFILPYNSRGSQGDLPCWLDLYLLHVSTGRTLRPLSTPCSEHTPSSAILCSGVHKIFHLLLLPPFVWHLTLVHVKEGLLCSAAPTSRWHTLSINKGLHFYHTSCVACYTENAFLFLIQTSLSDSYLQQVPMPPYL